MYVCRWVIGHFQRIALVDYLTAIGLALPPYKGTNGTDNSSVRLSLQDACTDSSDDCPLTFSLRLYVIPAGYNESVDPSIDTFFTVVAYRYGEWVLGASLRSGLNARTR